MLSARTLLEPALVACTVKVDVVPAAPAGDGVPLITPVDAFSASPPGSAPDTTDQLYGPLPPVAASGWLYAVPDVPLARVVVVTLIPETTVIESAWVSVCPALVTCAVKLDVPAPLGVPVIAPVPALSDRPAGSAPAEIAQCSRRPPVAVIVWL